MKILGMIMAGGEGSRLFPLTRQRAKPAVPFGGKYRIIDFVLSNFINSKIYSLYVLTQFKSQSLTEHLQEGWRFSSLLPDHFILPVPAQKQTGESWYRGTADAIYQNVNLFENQGYDMILVFGADHIYQMDIRQMIDFHIQRKADMTVSAIPVPIKEAKSFGVLQTDEKHRVVGFKEKPGRPKPIPSQQDMAYVSMGNYIFNTDFLIKNLYDDASNLDSSHDFGKDILPRVFKTDRVYAYDFASNKVPGSHPRETGYWRDVGTLKSFWEANMDLKSISPVFNLYNNEWPIRSTLANSPPAKFIFNDEDHCGHALNSIVSEGSIISGGKVEDSIICRQVVVESGSLVQNSIIMDRVNIGKNCKINMAIIDKDVTVPPNTTIGYDIDEDENRFFVDPESNLVVLNKGFKFT
ncbi:MAG: glucose-1-phosphate adenylyltransferase [Candidatus Nitrohelix vancouverensis]|uniref:Glucose-1-phosphate adenylyltransferase n=1 Tax=Candidatus Nitrohelix vancouverensis TaxID=2705534 RepID=A0A7T0G4U1_9BACT|nr:MAG: glucose-1-phosphate adenylyltransferase [Candidatus Nitrohelix vancouverensis]